MFTAMRYGLARGLYANEAGYGTAAVAYGTAQSDRPAQQGLNAVMEMFIVSFGTCTLTRDDGAADGRHRLERASRRARDQHRRRRPLAFNARCRASAATSSRSACSSSATATLIGWAYYGEQFLEYWLGREVVDAVSLDLLPADPVRRDLARSMLVWAWGDLMNALQIFPNLIGVLALSGIAAKIGARAQPAQSAIASASCNLQLQSAICNCFAS